MLLREKKIIYNLIHHLKINAPINNFNWTKFGVFLLNSLGRRCNSIDIDNFQYLFNRYLRESGMEMFFTFAQRAKINDAVEMWFSKLYLIWVKELWNARESQLKHIFVERLLQNNKNIEEYYERHVNIINISYFFTDAFVFYDTKEGGHFWSSINDKFKALVSLETIENFIENYEK